MSESSLLSWADVLQQQSVPALLNSTDELSPVFPSQRENSQHNKIVLDAKDSSVFVCIMEESLGSKSKMIFVCRNVDIT